MEEDNDGKRKKERKGKEIVIEVVG